MRDDARLEQMRSTPAVDGYHLTVEEPATGFDVRNTDDPELLLNDFADTLSRTGSRLFRHASAGVAFCPEHAQLLAEAGMSKNADHRGRGAQRRHLHGGPGLLQLGRHRRPHRAAARRR